MGKAIPALPLFSVEETTCGTSLAPHTTTASSIFLAADSLIRSRHPSGFAWRRIFKMRRQTLATFRPRTSSVTLPCPRPFRPLVLLSQWPLRPDSLAHNFLSNPPLAHGRGASVSSSSQNIVELRRRSLRPNGSLSSPRTDSPPQPNSIFQTLSFGQTPLYLS